MSDVAGWLGARATSAVRSLDFPANVWCHAAKPGVLGAGAATDCAKGVAEEILVLYQHIFGEGPSYPDDGFF